MPEPQEVSFLSIPWIYILYIPWFILITVVFAFALVFWYEDSEDYIRFSPSPTPDEKAVLTDGVRSGVFQNDWSPGIVPSATNSVGIGEFVVTASPNSGEVVAFSRNKAPFIQAPTPWSFLQDIVNVQFHDAYAITVKVWLLTQLAYNNKSDIEKLDCEFAKTSWKQEGHGLEITCDIRDARNESLTLTDGITGRAMDLFNNREFDCDTHASDLQGSGIYSSGFLNVYYVNLVSTVTGSGAHYGIYCNGTDPPDVIAVGVHTVKEILAHEIGHALIGNGDEDHIDNLSPHPMCSTMPTLCTTPLPKTAGNTPSLFDRTNVMHGASRWRATLTEGQIFRAFFNRNSALNKDSIYNLGLNLGLGNRICGGVGSGTWVPPVHTNECPQLEKRLWPDDGGEYGLWPAN